MTGPISSALAGVSYKGTMGSTGGDIGRVISQFVADAKAEKDRKEQLALAASLRAQDEAWKQRTFDQTQGNLDNDNQFNRDKLAQDKAHDDATLAASSAQHDTANAEHERTALENQRWHDLMAGFNTRRLDQGDTRNEQGDRRLGQGDRKLAQGDRGLAQGDVRLGQGDKRIAQRDRGLDQNDTRIAQTGQRGTMIQDEGGQTYRVNSLSGVGEPMVVDGSGNLMPRSKAGATPAVAPDGAPAKPVQPGQTETPAAAHSVTEAPAPPDSKPFMGTHATPSQGERDAAAQFTQLRPVMDLYKHNLASVGNEAPPVGIQFAMDGLRSSSNVHRMIGNIALGRFSPAWQKVAHSTVAFTNMVTYMMSGKQINENEGRRILNMFEDISGDTPETLAQKITMAEGIVEAQRVKMGRAAGDTTAPSTTPAAPAATPGSSPRQFWAARKAEGMSADDATKATLAQFPNATMRQ